MGARRASPITSGDGYAPSDMQLNPLFLLSIPRDGILITSSTLPTPFRSVLETIWSWISPTGLQCRRLICCVYSAIRCNDQLNQCNVSFVLMTRPAQPCWSRRSLRLFGSGGATMLASRVGEGQSCKQFYIRAWWGILYAVASASLNPTIVA